MKSYKEGYHSNTISAMAKAAPTFKVGDAIWVRNQSGEKVTGQVTELRPGVVVFQAENGKRYRAPEGRVVRAMDEGSMASAEHHPSGAKFGGYWKGTNPNPPKPGQGFGGMEEAEENPLGPKEWEALLAQAKANSKKSKIPNAELPKGDEHEIGSDRDFVGEKQNFLEWAVSNSNRFPNFAGNPEMYARARNAYLSEDIYGGIPKIAKKPAGTMVSNAKLPTLKTKLRQAKEQQARTAKALNKNLAEESEAESELKPGQYYIWKVYFDDGGSQRIKVTSDQFDPKAYYARLNRVVIKTDYDWTIHG